MGYIPPVRDEQAFQYGKRIEPSYRGIKPTTPVDKGNFLGILADKEKQMFNRGKWHNKQKNEKKHQVVRNLTGKGFYIDEVV